ncbi:hypothetical protein EOPP23_18475 [Endozoicomonas sp. OPT23]|uniref:diguanylate cyclase n=1 Tax=Endozoicomonas sp. OPT23 TaxID=2072845 RepID=UPI00129BAB16|nr:diguanylate cyclase [Endozoicomonas sp. OPT23]MRI34965.1 hypothetical protein [Endozoicomonas sp. OPT23]
MKFIFTLAVLLLSTGCFAADTIFESTGRTVDLTDTLVKISPPEHITNSRSEKIGEQWFRLDIEPNTNISSEWTLVFRRTPHQILDVFTHTEDGYRLHSLGSNSPAGRSDPRTVRLDNSEAQSIYLRASTSAPNRIQPILEPYSDYMLDEYRNRSLISGLQSLLLLFLVVSGVAAVYSGHQGYLLLASHLLVTSVLLITWQGDIFRYIPIAGDPGLWVMTATNISLVSALACYKNLGLLALYTPRTDRILLWLSLLSTGLFIAFALFDPQSNLLINISFSLIGLIIVILTGNLLYIMAQGVKPAKLALPVMLTIATSLTLLWAASSWPRATPSLAELSLICIQAMLITGLYWINRQQKRRQDISVNLITTSSDKRRVFDIALRKHLQAPASEPLDEKAIRRRILDTLDAVIPGTPSIVLTREERRWSINSYYPKASSLFKSRLKSISMELLSIIESTQHEAIIEDASGVVYWVFKVHTDGNHSVLLIVAAGKSSKGLWEIISDVGTHARTLFQANQQTRFWKLQASLDPLTGVLNRRAFLSEAEPMLAKAQEQNKQSCAIFMDIDNFKQINDTYGHPAGDAVLVSLARTLRTGLRQNDLLSRYGGEEFVVLLPKTVASQGVQIAERIRKAVMAIDDGPRPITISLGISATNSDISDLEQLLDLADQALYKAKNSGKNRVAQDEGCFDLTLIHA